MMASSSRGTKAVSSASCRTFGSPSAAASISIARTWPAMCFCSLVMVGMASVARSFCAPWREGDALLPWTGQGPGSERGLGLVGGKALQVAAVDDALARGEREGAGEDGVEGELVAGVHDAIRQRRGQDECDVGVGDERALATGQLGGPGGRDGRGRLGQVLDVDGEPVGVGGGEAGRVVV